MQKLRVGVFMGGRSVENEASFNSGRTVCDHLDTQLYEIVPIFQRRDGTLFILPWHFLHRGKTTDFTHRLDKEAQRITWDQLKSHADFIYLAIHGHYAEDGCLQGFLEILGIPYLGSGILTSALCMTKDIQKHILAAHGFHVPKGITLSVGDVAHFATNKVVQQLSAEGITLPYIVKPHKEGSSLGITVVHDHASLESAVHHACYVQPNRGQTVIIEEYIQGMEFSCIMLLDTTSSNHILLPPTEIVPEQGSFFFDYEQKYMPGRATKFTPARCTQEQLHLIQTTCLAVSELFAIKNISRVDGFLTPDNRVIITEPNTLCGMAPTSFLFRQAAEIGLTHAQLINHLIETELRARGMQV